MPPKVGAEAPPVGGLQCPHCDREPLKNKVGLDGHIRMKHPENVEVPADPALELAAENKRLADEIASLKDMIATQGVTGPGEVVHQDTKPVLFVSPRSAGLTIQILQSEWVSKNLGMGTSKNFLIPGLVAKFRGGLLRTDDPRVIAYLDRNVDKCKELGILDTAGKPRVYECGRHPVIRAEDVGNVSTAKVDTPEEQKARANANPE